MLALLIPSLSNSRKIVFGGPWLPLLLTTSKVPWLQHQFSWCAISSSPSWSRYASGYDFGAVLMQKQRPVGFFSKTRPRSQLKSIYIKECSSKVATLSFGSDLCDPDRSTQSQVSRGAKRGHPGVSKMGESWWNLISPSNTSRCI